MQDRLLKLKTRLKQFFFGLYTTPKTRVLHCLARIYELWLAIGIGSACIIALNRVLVHHTLDGVEVLAGIPLAVILIVIIEAILW